MYYTHDFTSTNHFGNSFKALGRLAKSLKLIYTSQNKFVLFDYPNFPASIPRRIPVFIIAMVYLSATRIICGLKGSKVIVAIDDIPRFQDELFGAKLSAYKHFWEKLFERYLLNSASHVWVAAAVMAEELCRKHNIPGDKVSIVPNGGDPGKGKPVGGGKFKFVYAGSLCREIHRIGWLIDTFNQVNNPHVELVLIGHDGDWIPSYPNYVSDSRIRYLGYFQAIEAQQIISTCHIGLLPYPREGYWAKIFPGKLGAYLACGVPVISTGSGDGSRVINQHEVGVVCRESELADLMERIPNDLDRYLEMKTNTERISTDYIWTNIFKRAVNQLKSDGVLADKQAVT